MVLPLGRRRVGARKRRVWQLGTPPTLATPSFPSGGGALATPLSIVDLPPTPPLPSSLGAGWGALPDFSHRFHLGSRSSSGVEAVAITCSCLSTVAEHSP